MLGSSKLKPRKAPVRFVDGCGSGIGGGGPGQGYSADCYPCWKWFADPFPISYCELSCPFQRPGEPRVHGLAIGSRTSVELRGSENVSYHPARSYILLILQCSWSAIFLYVYTSQITFAATGSQDATSKVPAQNCPSEDELKS